MKDALRSAKEVIRHFLHSTSWYREKPHRKHLLPPNRSLRFQAIYETGVWKHGNPGTPGSGEGSSVKVTRVVRERLPQLLEQHGVKTILDIGCGDFTWMKTTKLSQRYIGIDIVPSVIEANIRLYGSKDRSFHIMDAVVDAVPSSDVVLCREVLFHLSLADALALIANALSSGARLFIATSDPHVLFNSDIESGDYRQINLQIRPFCFPEPIATIDDDAIEKGRFLGVWNAEALKGFRKNI